MEHVDRAVLRKHFLHLLEGRQEKLVEFCVRHIVILNASGGFLYIDVVGRVGQHQINFGIRQQDLIGFRFGGITYRAVPFVPSGHFPTPWGITTEYGVFSQVPEVSCL